MHPQSVGSTSGNASYSDSGNSVGKRIKTATSVAEDVNVGISFLSPTFSKRRERLQRRSICNFGMARDNFAGRNRVTLHLTVGVSCSWIDEITPSVEPQTTPPL